MKFSIGDPVYITSNDEEGVIDEFIGIDMASVIVNSKSYHVFLSDIEHPYLRWFMNATKTKKKTPFIDQLSKEKVNPNFSKERKSILPSGIYLLFMPIYKIEGFEEVVEKVKIFLLNETLESYTFEYGNKVKNEALFSIESELDKQSQFYLHDISFENFAMSPTFRYRFINKKNNQLDNEDILVLKPKKVFEKIDEIKYANHAFFNFLLFEELKPRARQEVVIPSSKIVNQKKNTGHFDFEKALKKTYHEVDLHIEKLIKDYRGLSSSEILHIQRAECEKALDLAKATHQQTLIIIHGIGKGVLKNEIISLLNQTNGILKYVNEYDIRYGYGATKVFFRH
jgi:hypothetical protein